MSTAAMATVIAVNASVQASQAQQEAGEAKCAVIISDFDPKSSGVVEKQQYAECVQTLYPIDDALSQGQVWLFKAMIVCAIIGAFVGIYKCMHSKWRGDGLLDYVAFATIGVVVGSLIPPCIVGIFYSINFLVTA